MLTNTPSISIVMPVYNGAAYLKDAIESALRQTTAPSEILIVDDASTDATPQIISEYAGHPLVRTHRLLERVIAPIAWNRAIRMSAGTHFIILAHDDRIDPDFVKTSLEILAKNPETGFIVTGYRIIDQDGKVTENRPIASPRLKGPTTFEDFFDEMVNIAGMYFSDTGSVVSRSAFDAVDGFDENFRGGVYDFDFYIRLASQTKTYGYGPCLADYRIHSSNMSADLHRDDKGDGDVLFNKLAGTSTLSEKQKVDLAINISAFQFHHFTRTVRSPKASVDDVKKARKAVNDRLIRWASSNSPYATYVQMRPPRFRQRLLWRLGNCSFALNSLLPFVRWMGKRRSGWNQ